MPKRSYYKLQRKKGLLFPNWVLQWPYQTSQGFNSGMFHLLNPQTKHRHGNDPQLHRKFHPRKQLHRGALERNTLQAPTCPSQQAKHSTQLCIKLISGANGEKKSTKILHGHSKNIICYPLKTDCRYTTY